MSKVEELTEKMGLVIERTEEVDPEEGVTYAVLFLLDKGDEHNSTLRLRTDDEEFFDRFQINVEYQMSFLKGVEGKEKLTVVQKAN